MADLSLYKNRKGLSDYMDANKLQNFEVEQLQQKTLANKQALELKKQAALSGSDLPATIQIANEIDKALRAGDIERANLLHQVHKTMDKGINPYGVGQPFQYPAADNATHPGQFDTLNGALEELGVPQQDLQLTQPQTTAPPPVTFGATPMAGYGSAKAQIEGQVAGEKERQKLLQQKQLEPEIARLKALEGAKGKSEGEIFTEMQDRVSVMPQLNAMADRLSALGKLATYTYAGQARDAIMRQAGKPVPDSAVARREYTAMVDNEILPLLRQTFGAQFTEREGESLKRTLGDVNASPEEKDAVLRSFIRTKMETINSQARRIGAPEPYTADSISAAAQSVGKTQGTQTPQRGSVVDGYIFNGGNPADPNNWKKVQ